MELSTPSILAVVLFTSIALAGDLKQRKIPNWLTVSAAISGLGWNVVTSGFGGLATSLTGFATGFGILLVLWLIGGGGGGDVKLMGAIGAWLGALPTLMVFIASAGFAVLCAAGMIAWNRRQNALASRDTQSDHSERPSVLKQTVPYALPVALSIWALLLVHVMDV